MTATTYVRYELLRTFRSVRFFVFSLAFPLVLFLLVAGPNRHEQLDGAPFAVYYLTGMVAWGTMAAVVACGARIAGERSVGWNRQLRITPLKVPAYFAAKVLCGYAMAVISIVLLDVAAAAIGVRLSVGEWAAMTAMVLVGLIPFAALGVLMGHVLTIDSIGPAMGGATALFALLGGAWGPLASGGFLRNLSEAIPSYWLVQAGKLALGGGAWPLKGWLVLAVWTAVLGRLAMRAYRQDTARA
jgi:ABC-2 type transport system permease protein